MKYFSRKFYISILLAWQIATVVLMSAFGWPAWLAWVNVGLIALYMLLSPIEDGLLALIVSLPVLVIVPNPYFNTLAGWRPLIAWLFLVWIIKANRLNYKKIIWLPWDKYIAAFGALMLLSVLWSTYKTPAFMQFIFFANIAVLYFLIVQIVKTKEHLVSLLNYSAVSLTVFIAAGFAQLFLTFFTTLDTFWVFWAANVSKLYYGADFAQVSLYSNSWFSFTQGRDLRMFGIMPDSQSFAYLCVYGIGIGTALTASASKNFKRWLWAGIRFAGLGVILSGTRAVWVGMVAPLAAVTVLYWRNILRPAVVRFFWPLAIILVLFALSPFINRGLQYLRAGGVFEENFLARAQSIYNLSESSNAGRLVIWKDSAAFALRHPLGTGLNNFLVSVARPGPGEHKSYGELAEQKNERYNLPQKFITAHNLYLHIWVELGVVGLVAFAALWIVIAKQLWKFLRANKQASSIWVFTVAQAGLVFLWLGAAAFFDVTWYNDKALMFFFLELAVAGIVIRNYTPWKPETL